jgi:CheY-like chemotaxis protein
MMNIQLIHWNTEERDQKVEYLTQAGHTVDTTLPNGPPFLRKLSEKPPDAILIDLTRLPSQGREVAISIRQRKAIRQIPILFLNGEAEKVERVRQLLPDAVFTDWSAILPVLDDLSKKNVVEPVIVPSTFAAYSETPLAKKLGIKAGAKVGLIAEPEDFLASLGELPIGVTFVRGPWQDCELVIWFVDSRDDLASGLPEVAKALTRGSVWIAWKKKAGKKTTDLTQLDVREIGLANDLVDYKICAIDETWSGLLFTRRK